MTHVPWHPEDLERGEEIHGIDSVELHSVGIDVGTTTTHLMISRLLARRAGSGFSSEFRIDETERVYESEVFLTPYEDEATIDTASLEALVQGAFADSGFEPGDVDTGAVIVTGEASRKENAEAIAELFAERAGEFVCATAGADLEALMAAHGSGAVDHSLSTGQDVLHVDVGGGTTKLAYVVEGFVEETASINVGAHLVEFGDDGRTVTRFEEAARTVADRVGVDLRRGEPLDAGGRERLAEAFAERLFALIRGESPPAVRELMVTELPEQHPFDVLTFSGGGGEYVYGNDPGYHGDLGEELGAAIREAIAASGLAVDELTAGIRATAIGSTEHKVQLSGNTITLTEGGLLPLRNVPMVPFVVDADEDVDAVVETVREKLELYDVDEVAGPFAYGFHLHGPPTYGFLRRVVEAAARGWEFVGGDHPLVLAFETDVAMNAGRLAEDRVDAPVVSVDGVELDQFGYIDVGAPIEDTNAVPLTVKSLLFEG